MKGLESERSFRIIPLGPKGNHRGLIKESRWTFYYSKIAKGIERHKNLKSMALNGAEKDTCCNVGLDGKASPAGNVHVSS